MSGFLCGTIIFCGVLLTGATRGVQRYMLSSLKSVGQTEQTGDRISSFGVLCTTLGASLGTGNIVGVASAVYVGGAGAVFWMVISSFLCMAVKYCECFLGALYGNRGGPFGYVAAVLGRKGAVVFALGGAAAGAFGFGTLTQSKGVTVLSRRIWGVGAEWVAAVLIGILLGAALWGGGKKIIAVCESVVPMMAVGYTVCCLIILWQYRQWLPQTVTYILQSAITPEGVAGGFFGTVTAGVSRGVFSNEAGLGSAPIAAAQAHRSDPHTQGLVGMAGVLIDTTLMCTLSGLCVVVSGVGGEGALRTARVFETVFGRMGGGMVGTFLCFFAFTSMVGWYYFGQRCFGFLTGERYEKVYRCLYILMVILTPLLSEAEIWYLSDILMVVMATPNLLAVMILWFRQPKLYIIPKTAETKL